MNIKGSLAVLFEKAVAVSYKASELAGYTIYGTAAVDWMKGRSGIYMNRGVAGNDTIYSALRILLDKTTEAPLLLNEIKDEKAYNSRLQIKSFDDHKIIKHRLLSLKAMEEITKDPILDLLDNPNSYQSNIEFWEAFWGWYYAYGDAYVFGLQPGEESRNAGKPIELHVIPASIVTKQYGGDIWQPTITYQFMIRGVEFKLGQDDIWNLSQWNPTTGMPYGDGLSPLQAGDKVITKAGLSAEAQASAFKNGGRITVLSGDPTKGSLTPVQMDAMKQHINDQMKGAHNNGNKVFTNGYVNAQMIGDTIRDMSMIEGDNADRARQAILMGVDPILLGDKSASSYNNASEAYKGLVRNRVVSALNKRDKSLSEWLLPKFGNENRALCSDISYYSELQPDYAIVSSYVSNPKLILKSNEIRVLFGFDTENNPNYEKAIVPSGYMDYEEVFNTIDTLDEQIAKYEGSGY